METHRKIIGNAMISYFLLFVCIFLFLNKENKYINNDFVKSHTKTAFFIHILFLFVYILFVSLDLGRGVSFLDFSLNTIIASGLFIGLFWLLMYGMYQAHKWEYFTLWDVLVLTKTKNIVAHEASEEMSEKDTLEIILSYIPFIWFFTFGRNITSPRLSDIVQLNLIVSVIIALLYISGANNLGIFITLLYIVFVVYCIITLVSKSGVVSVSMKHVPTPTEKYIWATTLIAYAWSSISGKTPGILQNTYTAKKIAYYEAEKQRQEEQKTKKKFPLPLAMIYIPVINIFSLIFVNTQYKYHIISNSILSIFAIGSWFVLEEKTLVPLMILFPTCFAAGYYKRIGYQIPFVYDIYKVFAYIGYKITHIFSKGRAIQKTRTNVTLEVWEKTSSDSEKNQ